MEKKQCIICSQNIDQSDYLDHVSTCSIEKKSSIQVYLVDIFIYYLFRNL
jgi:hypothetical protein